MSASTFAGWAAYLSAAAGVLGILFLVLFFSLGEPFGTINDIFSVVLALSAMVVLYALYRLHQPAAPTASLVAFLVGTAGMLVAAVLQTLLIFDVIPFAQTEVTVPTAFGLFGVALALYGVLSLTGGPLPGRLAGLGIVAGAGYVVVIAGFILGGETHSLTTAGGLVTIVCYPAWAIWLGRLLLSGQLGA